MILLLGMGTNLGLATIEPFPDFTQYSPDINLVLLKKAVYSLNLVNLGRKTIAHIV
jgi:hypothetical protein